MVAPAPIHPKAFAMPKKESSLFVILREFGTQRLARHLVEGHGEANRRGDQDQVEEKLGWAEVRRGLEEKEDRNAEGQDTRVHEGVTPAQPGMHAIGPGAYQRVRDRIDDQCTEQGQAHHHGVEAQHLIVVEQHKGAEDRVLDAHRQGTRAEEGDGSGAGAFGARRIGGRGMTRGRRCRHGCGFGFRLRATDRLGQRDRRRSAASREAHPWVEGIVSVSPRKSARSPCWVQAPPDVGLEQA